MRSAIVATALVLTLGVGIGLSQAGKRGHKHSVPLKYVTQSVSISPGAVDGQIAFCPKGWKATGGGATGDGSGFPLLVNSGLVGKSGFEAIILNDGGSTARMQVRAACIKSTKKTRARAATESRIRGQLEARVKELRSER